MPRVFYMFFIILSCFAAVFIIFLMFVDHSTTHLIATDLNQAVTEDLQDSRDDSGRMEKGTYDINESEFKDNLAHHIIIKNLNTSHNGYDYIVRFQNDNSDNDKVNTDYINNYTTGETDTQRNNQVTPIRAVQVIAVPKKATHGLSLNQVGDDLENPDASSRAEQLSKAVDRNRYVSTVELQEFDLDANNDNRNPKINKQSSQDLYNHNNTHQQSTNDNNNDATDLSDND